MDKHFFDVPFMKLEIEDAFESAFDLKNFNTVNYFLRNGIEIDRLMADAVITLCYSLDYLPDDPPMEMVKMAYELVVK